MSLPARFRGSAIFRAEACGTRGVRPAPEQTGKEKVSTPKFFQGTVESPEQSCQGASPAFHQRFLPFFGQRGRAFPQVAGGEGEESMAGYFYGEKSGIFSINSAEYDTEFPNTGVQTAPVHKKIRVSAFAGSPLRPRRILIKLSLPRLNLSGGKPATRFSCWPAP